MEFKREAFLYSHEKLNKRMSDVSSCMFSAFFNFDAVYLTWNSVFCILKRVVSNQMKSSEFIMKFQKKRRINLKQVN